MPQKREHKLHNSNKQSKSKILINLKWSVVIAMKRKVINGRVAHGSRFRLQDYSSKAMVGQCFEVWFWGVAGKVGARIGLLR
jgi:hypothetical protein